MLQTSQLDVPQDFLEQQPVLKQPTLPNEFQQPNIQQPMQEFIVNNSAYLPTVPMIVTSTMLPPENPYYNPNLEQNLRNQFQNTSTVNSAPQFVFFQPNNSQSLLNPYGSSNVNNQLLNQNIINPNLNNLNSNIVNTDTTNTNVIPSSSSTSLLSKEQLSQLAKNAALKEFEKLVGKDIVKTKSLSKRQMSELFKKLIKFLDEKKEQVNSDVPKLLTNNPTTFFGGAPTMQQGSQKDPQENPPQESQKSFLSPAF